MSVCLIVKLHGVSLKQILHIQLGKYSDLYVCMLPHAVRCLHFLRSLACATVCQSGTATTTSCLTPQSMSDMCLMWSGRKGGHYATRPTVRWVFVCEENWTVSHFTGWSPLYVHTFISLISVIFLCSVDNLGWKRHLSQAERPGLGCCSLERHARDLCTESGWGDGGSDAGDLS